MEVSRLVQFERQNFIKQSRRQFEAAVDAIVLIPGGKRRNLRLIAGPDSFDAVEKNNRDFPRHQGHDAVTKGAEGDTEGIAGIALDDLHPRDGVSRLGSDGAADEIKGGKRARLAQQEGPSQRKKAADETTIRARTEENGAISPMPRLALSLPKSSAICPL
jgi:hypothetical protein